MYKQISITGFKNYYISNNGNIINSKTGKNIKQKINNGYYVINLYNNTSKKIRSFTVHRLIALLFLDNYDNNKIVNHKDCNKLNNNCKNLEVITQKENIHHALENKLIKHRVKKVDKFTINGILLETYDSIKDASIKNNIDRSKISKACIKKGMTHGFIWKYSLIKDNDKKISVHEKKSFKQINGYKNYLINENGIVVNKLTMKILKPIENNKGYCYVTLCQDTVKKNKYIHVLVAETFIKKNNVEQQYVNHINCIKNDNKKINLEWVTHSENIIHYNRAKKLTVLNHDSNIMMA